MAKDNNQNQTIATDPNEGLNSLAQVNRQERQNEIQPTEQKIGLEQRINEKVVDTFDQGVKKMDDSHITQFTGVNGKIVDKAAHYKQDRFHETLEKKQKERDLKQGLDRSQEQREFMRDTQDPNKQYNPNFKPKTEISKVKTSNNQGGKGQTPQAYDPNNPNTTTPQGQTNNQKPNLENKKSLSNRLVNPAIANQANKPLSEQETKKLKEKQDKEDQKNFNNKKRKEKEDNIKGQSRVPTDDEEDKKEKKRASSIVALLLWIGALVFKLFIAFLLVIVATFVLFAIFVFNTTFCPIISQPIIGLAIPDYLKAACKETKNVDDGCFIPKGGRYTEEDYELNVTNSARPLSFSNPQSRILPCIGKALSEEQEPTLELYGLKGNITIKKDIINQIIQAGKEAKVEENTIKLVIAIHPTQSLENAWKESFSSGCYGIAQLCVGGIANKNGEILDSNYGIATKDLGVKDVEDYLASPVLQMKSIQKFIDFRREQIKNLDRCFDQIFKGKIESYKLLYLWQDTKCEGDMEAIRVSKSTFAELAQSNFGLMECNEFKTKIVYIPNYLYTKNPIVNNEQKVVYEPTEIEKLAYTQAQAQFTDITAGECTEIKKYKPFLEETANKYSTPTLILSPAIIAGILSRETQVGLYIKGCAGYGDFGNGHGIGQADPSSGNGLPGPNTPVGFKVNRVTKKYGREEFVWSDCREGILYVGAHMMNLWEYADPIARNKISAAGLSLDVDDKGAFKDLKVKKGYMQLMLNAYNAGPTGMKNRCSIDGQGVVNDSCTSGRDYGRNTLARASAAAICLGITSDILDFVGNGIVGGIQGVINNVTGIVNGPSQAVQDALSKNFQGIICAGRVDAAKLFPLVTLTAKDVKIYYNWAYGDNLPNGQKSDGMFFSPDPIDPENTRVIAVQNGTIIDDHVESFTYCIPGGTAADCVTENIREIDIMGDNGTLHCYIQMDPSPNKRFLTTGAKVKPGDIIGQILNNKYVHLRFRAFLPGDNIGEPKTTIKWDNNIKPTVTKEAKGLIPKEWHQRDQF